MEYCSYYQAQIDKKNHLFLVGGLKYFDHVCFDRTLDTQKGLFEFFVPADQEDQFLAIMDGMKKRGIVNQLVKMNNRLTE